MQAYIRDSCKTVITDERKIYYLQIGNITFLNKYFHKDLCDDCFNKLKNTFFKDSED